MFVSKTVSDSDTQQSLDCTWLYLPCSPWVAWNRWIISICCSAQGIQGKFKCVAVALHCHWNCCSTFVNVTLAYLCCSTQGGQGKYKCVSVASLLPALSPYLCKCKYSLDGLFTLAMFVSETVSDNDMQQSLDCTCLVQLGQHGTDRIISICCSAQGVQGKYKCVAVKCHCHWHCCPTFANVNIANLCCSAQGGQGKYKCVSVASLLPALSPYLCKCKYSLDGLFTLAMFVSETVSDSNMRQSLDCTCLVQLGRHGTDRIISICCSAQGVQAKYKCVTVTSHLSQGLLPYLRKCKYG